MKKNKSLAQFVGSSLAIFQSAVDDVLAFAFKKVKDAGKTPRKKVEDPDSLKERAIDVAQKSATFLGEMGESFYDKYAELKTRKQVKQEKKNAGKKK